MQRMKSHNLANNSEKSKVFRTGVLYPRGRRIPSSHFVRFRALTDVIKSFVNYL
jgi:hypothetical protein